MGKEEIRTYLRRRKKWRELLNREPKKINQESPCSARGHSRKPLVLPRGEYLLYIYKLRRSRMLYTLGALLCRIEEGLF
jgi:transposase